MLKKIVLGRVTRNKPIGSLNLVSQIQKVKYSKIKKKAIYKYEIIMIFLYKFPIIVIYIIIYLSDSTF